VILKGNAPHRNKKLRSKRQDGVTFKKQHDFLKASLFLLLASIHLASD